MSLRDFGLYIHIPYCSKKCPYCDFTTFAVRKVPEKDYLEALELELDFYLETPKFAKRKLNSIYFGGGSPSIFSAEAISKLINLAISKTKSSESIEISLEANPEHLDLAKLKGFKEAGINRLSLGSQSMNSKMLSVLGRDHGPENIRQAVFDARRSGFNNINLDFMFAVPGQDLDLLREDLKALIALKPEHISAYSLTIEKGTPFFLAVANESIKLIKEELAADMFELVPKILKEHSFSRYEISNYAKAGFQSVHNLAYWEGRDYLGLGAGAHSLYVASNKSYRWSNLRNPEKYIQSQIEKRQAQAWQEELSCTKQLLERLMLGLRKIDGISLKELKNPILAEPYQAVFDKLDCLAKDGLISLDGNTVRLSSKGLLFADTVFENLMH